MDGIHDMGGMHGFGRVEREADEPVFHHDWEKRVFAISLQAADSVGFVDDHLRRSIERIPPDIYLTASYYELWLRSMEAIFEEKGILSPDATERRMVELKRSAGDG
jgi:nitrile hydratase subunit beta